MTRAQKEAKAKKAAQQPETKPVKRRKKPQKRDANSIKRERPAAKAVSGIAQHAASSEDAEGSVAGAQAAVAGIVAEMLHEAVDDVRARAQDAPISPDQRSLFLRTLAATCNVAAACRAARISSGQAYWNRKTDAGFAEAWEAARGEAIDELEGSAYQRANVGTRRLKFTHRGEAIIDPTTGEPYVEHEYSDTLTVTLLKAHRPERYRDSVKVDAKVETSSAAVTTPQEVLDLVRAVLPGVLDKVSTPGR